MVSSLCFEEEFIVERLLVSNDQFADRIVVWVISGGRC